MSAFRILIALDPVIQQKRCGSEEKRQHDILVREPDFPFKSQIKGYLTDQSEGTEAAEILIRDGWQVKLTVAGDIGDEFYRELFASKYFINYVGKKKKEELINYYRDADVFVLPSHKETFGLVYAEAMSQGLPVIYTRGQGFDGQFDDGEVGYAVSDTDPAEIAEKIKLIVSDYENVSKRCTERSFRYKWETVASRLLEECYKK